MLSLVHLQDPALLAAEIAFSMQQYHRTVGYDAVAVDWADYGTQKTPDTATKPHSCNHAHSEEAVKTSQKLLKLQQQLQEIIRQGRVTGYDAPAIDPDQQLLNAALKPVSAASPAAAAVGVVTIGSAKSVQRVELQAVRQYYKNPCNNPDAQYYYKSSFDYPGHRVYYKNPANAPIYLHEEGTAVSRAYLYMVGRSLLEDGPVLKLLGHCCSVRSQVTICLSVVLCATLMHSHLVIRSHCAADPCLPPTIPRSHLTSRHQPAVHLHDLA